MNETTDPMEARDVTRTCVACPTIFEWRSGGTPYYFRLRHGYWMACNDVTDEVIASGTSVGLDGICSWDEAKDLMREGGLKVNDA